MARPKTTIADTLRHIFGKLGEAIPDTPNTSLFKAWYETLGGGPERGEPEVLSGIMEVYDALKILEIQLVNSEHLDDGMKRTGALTINAFKVLFSISNLNSAAQGYKPLCSEASVANLAYIGMGLDEKYSTLRLGDDQIASLLDMLKEIDTLLQSSFLAPDLRRSLLRHISTMIWWLEHPDMVYMQDMFERAGASVILARQMEERASGEQSGANASSITAKLVKVVQKLAPFVSFTVKNIDQLEHAGHIANVAIESL